MIRGWVFTVRGRAKRHRDALGLLLVGASLVISGGVLAERQAIQTEFKVTSGLAVPTQAETERQTQVININTADQFALESLPRIGPAIAARIVEYRQNVGGFSSIEQIQEVRGIGPAIFEQIKDRIIIQ